MLSSSGGVVMLSISCLWPLAYLEREAAVVGIICAVFLILFVVAGIRQILKDNGQHD
jgi:hypothetical protein